MRLNKRFSKFLGPAAGLAVIIWVIVWQAGGCGKRIAPGRAVEAAAAPEKRTLTVAFTNVPVVYTAVGTILTINAPAVNGITAVNVGSGPAFTVMFS